MERQKTVQVAPPKRNRPKKKHRRSSQPKHKRGGLVTDGNLTRYKESIERANEITAHFVQGGRPDSDHRKH
jgi:hypothetical protein